jgi:hypothetical protein
MFENKLFSTPEVRPFALPAIKNGGEVKILTAKG